MDGVGDLRERASSRAPSRTSTNSSHSHRFHHANCASPSSTGPQVSSFLQERIQRRQAEKKMSGELSVSSGSARDGDRDRDVHSSPIRRTATAMSTHARSNSGDEDKGNMGVKEMEKAASTLHKQNFDLKLELYHRREKQMELEEKTKRLEQDFTELRTQHVEVAEMNDSLVSELEKRDKAVAEAIEVICDLQARVDELLREREMVRIVEEDYQRHVHARGVDASAQGGPEDGHRVVSPAETFGAPSRLGDLKTLERMSSFLSEPERNETTPNLRGYILNNKSSLLHMRKVSESSVDPSEVNRLASPSGLSVLSESSFASVYGKNKRTPATTRSPAPQRQFSTTSSNGTFTSPNQQDDDGWQARKSSNARSASSGDIIRGGASLLSQVQPGGDIRNIASPLQQVEMLGRKLSVGDSSRPSTSSHGKGVDTPSRPRPKSKTKQEKREALRKVITSSPSANDFDSSRVLPPTPDTISSSTLRRYQNSNDTLSRDPRVTPKDSFTDSQALPVSGAAIDCETKLANTNFSKSTSSAYIDRRNANVPVNQFATFGHHAHALPQRPRSADETTISRHRANSWMSDSDSDGGADACSDDDDLDPWLRESVSSNRGAGSPDLFSFPAEAGRWQSDALFGALRGSGFLGSPPPELKREPLDHIHGALSTPRTAVFQPPTPADSSEAPEPPPRRSSITRTGSSHAASPKGGKIRKNLLRANSGGKRAGRARSNSIDSAQVAPPAAMQADYQTDGAGQAKRNQYPPISGQLTRSRGFSGLGGLFRRSLGGSQQASPTEAAFTPEQVQQPLAHTQAEQRRAQSSGRSSVPPPAVRPWKPQAAFDDDLTSATPPPIMRNRVYQPSVALDTGDDPTTPRKHVAADANDVDKSETVVSPGSGTGTPQGGRRKWLGLGRMNSLKNRAG
ncbi:uncharacterized protein JN550_012454 [Neoarthrinium moseri]|uniref:uncharacterized protein n=1 Tax=Neoarthrinium moseri TaxID=1658444 RepID=UPI001FDCD883|nr:uncharacterized protein JN550_012454 [Neoarthrinium moseri]KAI1858800.1 hypothetical protein JN550_012454 [Neoarthrinium moseri]